MERQKLFIKHADMIMNTVMEEKVSFLQELISLYETRVSLIGAMVANTYRTLEEFRTQRELINTDISEVLAKHKSLRHKDFNAFMKDIDDGYRLKELAIKNHLNNFFEEHKKSSQAIHKKLSQEKIGDIEMLREFLGNYQKKQESELEKIEILLNDFQIEYQYFLKSVCKALEDGELMSIRKLKEMLKNN